MVKKLMTLITFKRTLIYILILTFLGIIFNLISPYKLFYAHFIILVLILVISIYAVKKFTIFFENDFSNDNFFLLNTTLRAEKNTFEKRLNFKRNIIISIAVVIFYFFNIFLLKYINLDIIGIYATVLGGLALFFSIIGYVQFFEFILFLKRISESDLLDKEVENYNMPAPARTPWLIVLSKRKKKFQTIFFILGLLFSIEYALLIPRSTAIFNISIINSQDLEFWSWSYWNSLINVQPWISFVLTWLGIIVFIIIGFPVFSWSSKKSIKKLISKIKEQQIIQFEKLLYESTISKDHNAMVSYLHLIDSIKNSPNYPIDNSLIKSSILLSTLTVSIQLLKLWPLIEKLKA